MRIENWEVRQGDSTNLKHITITGVTNYTITGGMAYRGNVTVLDKSTKKPVGFTSPIAVHATNGFTVGLYPEHTKQLGLGTFLVVFEITGEDETGLVVYRRELEWEITVTKSLLNVT